MDNYIIGDTVLVNKNTSSHNYAIGKSYKIVRIEIYNRTLQLEDDDHVTGNNIYFEDVKKLTNLKTLTKSSDILNDEITLIRQKIQFLVENKFDKFDDLTFKTYQIMDIVNEEISKSKKIEKIKLVINNSESIPQFHSDEKTTIGLPMNGY